MKQSARAQSAGLRLRQCAGLGGLAVLWMTFAGCSTPIGTHPGDHQQQYRQSQRSALNHDGYSDVTQTVLRYLSMEATFAHTPRAVLAELHKCALQDERRDFLFALAELNILQGERLRRSAEPGAASASSDAFLSAAIYSYYFLFGEATDQLPSAFDSRFRTACDFYNYGLARGLANPASESNGLSLHAVRRRLPGGAVEFSLDGSRLLCPMEQVGEATPADLLQIHGLAVRHRTAGIGAPLVLVARTNAAPTGPRQFPATAFLRLPGSLRAWQSGTLTGSLEFHPTFDRAEVEVAGGKVPLKSDSSAALAYAFNDPQLWRLGRSQFFSAKEQVKSGLYPIQPYQLGRVPVIFVHGTFSSPVHWAQTWNTLRADPALRDRFQFWCFVYNSGNPVSYSAARLHDAIEARLREFDPEQRDPALKHLVIVGHSQGGLLTKLMVTDTGDGLWRAVSDKPLAELDCSPEVRSVLSRNFEFQRVPAVERVVFVATPHRGSFLASGLVQRLARWLVAMPETLVTRPGNWFKLRAQLKLPPEVKATVPTSIDGMSPRNPWLLALAELPPATGVKAHSIIALKPGQTAPDGNDGVVKYRSAQVDYVVSQYVTRGPHSCQGQPDVIEELRRILLLHLAEMSKPESP